MQMAARRSRLILTFTVSIVARQDRVVIRSFKSTDAEKFWKREHVQGLGPELQRAAQKRLRRLNAASELNSLRVPPGSRLEKLVGDRAGQHSIRINDRYRICCV